MFRRGGLAIGDFVQGNNDGGVAAAGIVKEQTRNLLDAFDAKFVKEGRDVGISKLNFLAVYGSCPAMGRMLRFGRWRVTQREEGFWDIGGHGNVDVTGLIVPVNFETEVTGPSPVDSELIPGGKASKQMIGVFLGEVLDAEIINGEGEGGATCCVTPETGGVTDRVVAVWSKVGLELVIRENGGFLEAIHALPDFDVDVSFGVEMCVGQAVFFDHFLSEILAMDPHVLIDDHIRDEEEVLEVASTVSGTEMGIGDHTVEVELGVDESNGGRADILIGVKTVTTDSHAEAVDFGFSGAHGADEICVRDLAAGRHLVR